MGFLVALVLTVVGLWTRCRNCLTTGVILSIVCLGVAIHNCLRRGDMTPAIPPAHRGALESIPMEEEVLAAEAKECTEGEKERARGEKTSNCGSMNGSVPTHICAGIANQDENGGVIRDGAVVSSGHVTTAVEGAAQSYRERPRPRRESALHSLTRAIIATLTRPGRGGGGGLLTGAGCHHVPRNAWNSNFEGHIGWQSALARPDPFYSTSSYR